MKELNLKVTKLENGFLLYSANKTLVAQNEKQLLTLIAKEIKSLKDEKYEAPRDMQG